MSLGAWQAGPARTGRGLGAPSDQIEMAPFPGRCTRLPAHRLGRDESYLMYWTIMVRNSKLTELPENDLYCILTEWLPGPTLGQIPCNARSPEPLTEKMLSIGRQKDVEPSNVAWTPICSFVDTNVSDENET